MTPSTSLAIAEGLTEVFEWRTLAEPVYGIRSIGDAVRLPAGSLIQVVSPRPELGDTVEAVACPEGRLGEWDEYSDVLVTASALRFEDPFACVCRTPGCELRDADGATAEVGA